MRTLALALVVLTATACIDRRDYAVATDAGDLDALGDAPPGNAITVAVVGPGRVSADRRGIDCPGECVATYPPGGAVTLVATPDGNGIFKEWTGDCIDDGPCVLDTDAAHSVTAVFVAAPQLRRLRVTRAGTGTGTVTSTPAGIACGATCAFDFAEGAAVTLTATAPLGSAFTGWSGDCAGVAPCTVTMSAARDVTATFAAVTVHNLQVIMSGAGSGEVRSTPAGIVCTSGTCNAGFPEGSVVQLTASAGVGAVFTGWGGSCNSIVGPVCNVTMSSARMEIANFAPTAVLTVARTGAGTGTVTSSPAGIACGTDCSETYAVGTGVTLTATPAIGSRFVQWSGACGSAVDACGLTLTADTTVVAEFALATGSLTVTRTGTGTGTVTSSPAGINCGADCTEAYPGGTTVTLTAAAAVGSIFDGWSGPCTSTTLSTCTTTISGAMNVTAQFSRLDVITVRMSGQGSVVAQVTPLVGPTTCTHTIDPCSLTYRAGTSVSFVAMPGSGYHFDSFVSMVCSSSPSSCAFTVAGPDEVEAFFCPTGSC